MGEGLKPGVVEPAGNPVNTAFKPHTQAALPKNEYGPVKHAYSATLLVIFAFTAEQSTYA